jgi:hypothetical protein
MANPHTYLIHIGLDALGYNAFTRRWEDLARNASQVSELVRSDNTSWGPRR